MTEELWNPSPEEFDSYTEKEVELAKRNIKTLKRKMGKDFNHGDMLHSSRVIIQAMREIQDE